ncbi:DNA-binding regulatory protein, YebC/PmpR family [Anaerobranca californiensis DSM 14826]|jgi:YebC/PmpR family DNA-binding regulatory protein|uniref:Probable transcriptional regulatory protein SAMN02745227_00600 n=1 Tax=Anaerobranca californiensis DSM 14826 TaxID=1120989 RepID=A0A1M6LQ97_9FIRM|nr:YebC/PmpR family DNA-binding transcriptional regulator [Anaerobranca californiensis]SHJ73232.1 DNA-binding regulatory protein, YebC/PmpR family [Anaerobranca californiensis DSM 14826]
MAGHSKWANIKHRKSRVDAQRGKIFTKIAKEIMVAVKQGGPDPEGNFKLRLAIQKARLNNMPNDNIQRAIQRGLGDLDGSNYEEVIYEGYGPGGAALLLEILTDNRNRTAPEIRHILSKHGGSLGESGCVAWMFQRRGLLVIEKTKEIDEDEFILAALDAGALDVKLEEDSLEVITEPSDFEDVKQALNKLGYTFVIEEVTMIPQTTISLEGNEKETMEKLLEILEDHNDIQNVYTNYER